MPNAGKLKVLDAVEYDVSVVATDGGSGDGSPNNQWEAYLTVVYAPDAIDTTSDIYLAINSAQDPGGDHWGAVSDGAFPYTTGGSTYKSSMSLTLRFNDVKLYQTLFTYWRIMWNSVDLLLDGGVVHSWGSGSTDSARVAPDSIPTLFGLTYMGNGTVAANRASYVSPPTGSSYAFHAEINCTISGGYRFKENGTWYSLPASLPTIPMPTVTGAAVDPSGIVVTSNTWGTHLVVGQTKDFSSTDIFGPSWYTTTAGTGAGGSVGIVPNTPRGIVRMNDDYRAMWYRLARPNATATGTRINVDPGSGPGGHVTHSGTLETEILPARSALLGSVGNATHPIEDNLFDVPYCLVQASRNESTAAGADDGPVPKTSHTGSYGYPYAVGTVGNYLGHQDAAMRYWNTVANPMWLYWHWFPQNVGGDETDPGTQSQWPVDGGSVPNQYWKSIREQWQSQSDLPSDEKRKTRNHMIASSVDDSGHTPWIDNFVGENLRPLGISRWLTQDVTWPTSKTLAADSETAWSVDGCTAVFGTDVVLSGSGTRTLDLDMATWNHAPYLYPHLADRIGVGWAGTNVASVQVSLVGIDGEAVPLATAPGTYARPFDRGTEYAGSWGVGNGNGFVSDLGTDSIGSGRSASTMGDPELAMAFSLLPGRTAYKLRFVVTPVDASLPTTVHYPTFYRPSVKPSQHWESAQCCAWLWADGPGVRWGSFYWYDPDLGFQDPPLPKGLGVRNTIIDWLCWRREALEGLHALDGLTTELTSLYDTTEGQSIAVVDKFSLAFPLPGASDETIRAALVNTMAEFPPLAAVPWKDRDSHWQPTGTHSQKVWDWCQEPRRIVAAGTDPLVLKKPDDTVVSSAFSVPSGWRGQTYNVPLDNDETGWKLAVDGTLFATLRPWHGWFWSGAASSTAQNPHLAVSPLGSVYLAYGQDGTIRSRRARGPVADWDHDSLIDAGPGDFRPRLAYDHETGRLLCAYERTGHCYLRESKDGGKTWESAIDMGTGYRPELGSSHTGGLIHLRLDDAGGGAYHVYVKHRTDAAGLVWSTETLVTDQAGNPIACSLEGWGGIVAPWNLAGGWLLSIVPFGESSPVRFLSRERKALTFKRVS